MKTFLAVLGALWLASAGIAAAIFLVGHLATEHKARQWRREFRDDELDDCSIHAWLESGR